MKDSYTCVKPPYGWNPVSSDNINQAIGLAFQTGGCLLLHESSAEWLSAIL